MRATAGAHTRPGGRSERRAKLETAPAALPGCGSERGSAQEEAGVVGNAAGGRWEPAPARRRRRSTPATTRILNPPSLLCPFTRSLANWLAGFLQGVACGGCVREEWRQESAVLKGEGELGSRREKTRGAHGGRVKAGHKQREEGLPTNAGRSGVEGHGQQGGACRAVDAADAVQSGGFAKGRQQNMGGHAWDGRPPVRSDEGGVGVL